MTLADVTGAYDLLRQKEQRLAEAIEKRRSYAIDHHFQDRLGANVDFAKDEVDRALQLFLMDLKQYILEP